MDEVDSRLYDIESKLDDLSLDNKKLKTFISNLMKFYFVFEEKEKPLFKKPYGCMFNDFRDVKDWLPEKYVVAETSLDKYLKYLEGERLDSSQIDLSLFRKIYKKGVGVVD